MEQVFILLAILVFWLFKGVAGAQRRAPGQDPYEIDDPSQGGSRDVVGAARQKTLESQERALEALQRWEEKQRLSSGYGGPAQAVPGPAAVPAASRTRVGRPAKTVGRTATRHRKEAYAEIARMLDQETPAPSQPVPQAAQPSVERRPSDAALRREAEHKDEAAHQDVAAQTGAATGRDDKAATLSSLARLEALPLAARAIVYAEIFGPPRSLS